MPSLEKVELWVTGPIQIPFSFCQSELSGYAELSSAEINGWKAGDKVIVAGYEFTVAKQLLPEAGKVSLHREA